MANPSPAITFQVDLTTLSSEKMGPATNETSQAMCNPDADHTARATRTASRSGFLPSYTIYPHLIVNHGDEFTEYGTKAIYLRDMYGVGYAPSDRAFLIITEVA